MPLIETGPGTWERVDGGAPQDVSPEQEHAVREFLDGQVRKATRDGSLDDLVEAIAREAIASITPARETVGALTDPYIDSNTLMGVTDLNPRLAAAWNNGARDLGKDERRREVSRARLLSVFAPPAHNAVRQHVNYVIGEGIAKPTAADGNDDIQAVIDDLWSDPANYEFTTHAGQRRTASNHIIDGETFIAIAIDDSDGHCKWRTVDPLDVDDLVTDPDDASRVLYYRVRVNRSTYDFDEGIVRDGPQADQFVYYRDWRNTDPENDPYTGKIPDGKKAPPHMVMAHWPYTVLGLRGIPDMVCAAPWVSAHKAFMNNRTILHEALAKIAFVKTVKGGAPQIGASQLAEQSSLTGSAYSGMERNPQPAPYAIYTKNAGIDIEQMKVESGASNAQTDGEMLAQMFSTGIGLPTHYSIMSVEAHRLATATAMELPVLKMFLSAQQACLDTLRGLIDFALLQAATAKRIKAKVVTKHGREVIDWTASPASPKAGKLDDPAAGKPANVTPFRKRKDVKDDATANVREALADNDALAQAEHTDKAQEPAAQAQQVQKKRGNYTIDMPPILQKDVLQTIQAVVAALQAGTLTPEMAANQVMITLGFEDVSDKLDEWRAYVQTQAQQAVDRAAQERDLAQQQASATGGAKPGGPPPPPSGGPLAGVAPPTVTAKEAFTDAQLALLAEAGLTLVREAGGAGHWITIEQDGETTHIFIGAHGMVTKGPSHLIGANIAHLPPVPGQRSVVHHPEGHVPIGAAEHPHYTEHQEKKHIFGKHGPGVGYDVDNPLPKKTKEEAEEGLQKSVEALKEHKAAEAKERNEYNAAEFDKTTPERPHAPQKREGSDKYHIYNSNTMQEVSEHATEEEARSKANSLNDEHQATEQAKRRPFSARQQPDGRRDWEVVDKRSGRASWRHKYATEDAAQQHADTLNDRYVALQKHDLTSEEGWNSALLAHLKHRLDDKLHGGAFDEGAPSFLKALNKSTDVYQAVLLLAKHAPLHHYGDPRTTKDKTEAALARLDEAHDDIHELEPKAAMPMGSYGSIAHHMRSYVEAFGKLPTMEELKPENRDAFTKKVDVAHEGLMGKRAAEKQKDIAGKVSQVVEAKQLKDAGVEPAQVKTVLSAVRKAQSVGHLLHALAAPFVSGDTFNADAYEKLGDQVLAAARDTGAIERYSQADADADRLVHGLRYYFANNEELPAPEKMTAGTLNRDASNGPRRAEAKQLARRVTEATRAAFKSFKPMTVDQKEVAAMPIEKPVRDQVERAVEAQPEHIQALLSAMRARPVIISSTRGKHRPEMINQVNPATGEVLPDTQIAGTWYTNAPLYARVSELPDRDGLAEIYAEAHTYSDPGHTMTHELGHAFDEAGAALFGALEEHPFGTNRAFRLSDLPDFQAIYEKHQANFRLWDYMRAKPFEMFAEGYAMWQGKQYNHGSGEDERGFALKDSAPELYDYFEQLNERIRHHVAGG